MISNSALTLKMSEWGMSRSRQCAYWKTTGKRQCTGCNKHMSRWETYNLCAVLAIESRCKDWDDKDIDDKGDKKSNGSLDEVVHVGFLNTWLLAAVDVPWLEGKQKHQESSLMVGNGNSNGKRSLGWKNWGWRGKEKKIGALQLERFASWGHADWQILE